MKRFTVAHIAPLIEKYNGNLAAVARHCKVPRTTIYNHLQRSPELRQALQSARESMLDNAESKLYDAILNRNDTTALIFFLKTQGRTRGYSEKLDIAMSQDKRPQDMTDDELEQYIAALSTRFSGS
ncbi:MAG TPA: hypothetical protein VFT66_15700 [Roseiflexaceae bacterium]|nr:hypothetical protein [Roseiflexaceae bacterium]